MSYKISVIIPCYNAETTLKRCINSVINQSIGFDKIELILYDDASTDSTRKIIKDYATKFPNIVPVYSDENSGFPVRGRNKGIEIATADYIMFMDNDDEFDLNICEFFYNELEKSNPDMISCGKANLDATTSDFARKNPEEQEKIHVKTEDIIYFDDRFIWNKIFKKSIISENNITFPENKYAEDLYFTVLYLIHCDSLINIPDYQGYIRHVQEDSISRTWNLKDLTNILSVDYLIYNKISELKDIDPSRLFQKEIGILLYKMYSLHLLNDKKEAIEFLKKLYEFENEFSFDLRLHSAILNIANNMLLKKRFGLCYHYLTLVEKIYNSSILRKAYRKV